MRVLNPSGAIVGIVFPPINIPTEDLSQIHSQILKQFPLSGYVTFNLLPQGGALILKVNGSYIHIAPNMVQVNEVFGDEPFPIAKEKIVGIFKTVFEKVKPQVSLVSGVKLISQPETNMPDGAISFISTTLLAGSLNKNRIENLLGPTLHGIGIRFTIAKDQPKSTYDLRIEPYFREPKKLFVELDVQFPGPNPAYLRDLEGQIDLVATFLRKEVKEYLTP